LTLSAAKEAGNCVFVAELDAQKKAVVSVAKPWAGLGVDDVVVRVSEWLSTLSDAWVALDARLGLPYSVVLDLELIASKTNQRQVARDLVARFPTLDEFKDALGIVEGRYQNRQTDTNHTTPLDTNRTPKTYAALSLVSKIPETVALVPSEHEKMSSAPVKLVEVCAPRFLAAKWKDYLDYDRKRERREAFLDAFLKERGWTCSDEFREVALAGAQSYGVDAVIGAALAEWASKQKPGYHAKRAKLSLVEGDIYSP
jgi:hypothetical protein